MHAYETKILPQTNEAAILTKALCRAADYWALSNRQLSEIIGLSEASISRMKKGNYILEPESKTWELALLFLRCFRGLDAYLGGHKDNSIAWLNAHNIVFQTTPIAMMKEVAGLAHITQYIDAIRGQ